MSSKANQLNINILKDLLDYCGTIVIFYSELPNEILKNLLSLRSSL